MLFLLYPNMLRLLNSCSSFDVKTFVVLSVGDDCIAILSGCSNINITEVACGPSHGIRFVLVLYLDNTYTSQDAINFIDFNHVKYLM